jgi:hypothetical protein
MGVSSGAAFKVSDKTMCGVGVIRPAAGRVRPPARKRKGQARGRYARGGRLSTVRPHGRGSAPAPAVRAWHGREGRGGNLTGPAPASDERGSRAPAERRPLSRPDQLPPCTMMGTSPSAAGEPPP